MQPILGTASEIYADEPVSLLSSESFRNLRAPWYQIQLQWNHHMMRLRRTHGIRSWTISASCVPPGTVLLCIISAISTTSWPVVLAKLTWVFSASLMACGAISTVHSTIAQSYPNEFHESQTQTDCILERRKTIHAGDTLGVSESQDGHSEISASRLCIERAIYQSI